MSRGATAGGRRRPAATEPEWLSQLARGEQEGLAGLLQQYGPTLTGYLQRLLSDRQLAEEALQDVLFRVWQQATGLRPETLRAFLFRLCRNRAFDLLRVRQASPPELAEERPAPGADRVAELRWLYQEISGALEQLPLTYREVLELRYFQQLKYEEIGQVLEIPLGTVKSRLNYGHKLLARELLHRGIDAQFLH